MTTIIDGRELQPPEPMERTLEALALCEEEAERPSGGKRGRFSNFFSRAFEGQLQERTKVAPPTSVTAEAAAGQGDWGAAPDLPPAEEGR